MFKEILNQTFQTQSSCAHGGGQQITGNEQVPAFKQILRTAGAALACVAVIAVLYRVQILTSGKLLPGDVIDARIALALEQHWYNVFRGLESWNQPVFFLPTPDTLGYNDGYFLFGIFFSVFRMLGLDIFLSGEMAGVIFRIIGFVGLLLFGFRVCHLPYGWALVAAIIATLSGALFLQQAHVQLLTVGLAPTLTLLVCLGLRALRQGARIRGIVLLSISACLFDAWLLTAFYTAWFTVFFTTLAGATAIFLNPISCRKYFGIIRVSDCALPLALLIVGAIPFFWVYLPKAHETGMHPITETMGYTPSLLDVIHIGSGNALFGWLDALVTASFRPGFPNWGEHTVGFAPVLLCLALIGSGIAIWERPKATVDAWWRPLAVAFLLSLLLTLHVRDFSLWRGIYEIFPGAKVVRVVARYFLLLDVVAVLLAVRALVVMAHRRALTLVIIATFMLIGEEITTDGYFNLDRAEETRVLIDLPKPPAICRAFYVEASRVLPPWSDLKSLAPTFLNVDGMFIAEAIALPTLNGHASFLPADFKLAFRDTNAYLSAVRDSIVGHNLDSGMCSLDLRVEKWSRFGFLYFALGQDVSFDASGEAGKYLMSGWSGSEPLGRWTSGPYAEIGMSVDRPNKDMLFALEAAGYPRRGNPSPVDVFANGHPVAHWYPGSASQVLKATIPAQVITEEGALRIRFVIADPVSPNELGQGEDSRKLGLFVKRMQLLLVN